jgi:hypothetical protein
MMASELLLTLALQLSPTTASQQPLVMVFRRMASVTMSIQRMVHQEEMDVIIA